MLYVVAACLFCFVRVTGLLLAGCAWAYVQLLYRGGLVVSCAVCLAHTPLLGLAVLIFCVCVLAILFHFPRSTPLLISKRQRAARVGMSNKFLALLVFQRTGCIYIYVPHVLYVQCPSSLLYFTNNGVCHARVLSTVFALVALVLFFSSGDSLPAAGFGFGDAVIVELLSDKGLLPKDKGPGVTAVVFAWDAELQVWRFYL